MAAAAAAGTDAFAIVEVRVSCRPALSYGAIRVTTLLH